MQNTNSVPTSKLCSKKTIHCMVFLSCAQEKTFGLPPRVLFDFASLNNEKSFKSSASQAVGSLCLSLTE